MMPMGFPITIKDNLAELRKTEIHATTFSEKPKLLRTESKNSQSIVSNALAISILTARFPPKCETIC